MPYNSLDWLNANAGRHYPYVRDDYANEIYEDEYSPEDKDAEENIEIIHKQLAKNKKCGNLK